MGSLYDEHKNNKAVAQEFDVSKDPVEIFKAHQEEAARQVVFLMQTAISESLRFKAAKYLLDNVVFMKDEESDTEKFINSLQEFTEGSQ